MADNGSASSEIGIPVLASIIAVGVLGLWAWVWFMPTGAKPRSLGAGKPPDAAKAAAPASQAATCPNPTIAQTATAISVVPMPGEWPGFRGPNRDSVAQWTSKSTLTVTGLRVSWKIPVAEGYAAPAVKDGRVFLIDYDTNARQDALRCLRLSDGKEVWRNAYGVDVKRNHGITRTIPATDGHIVVSIGPEANVLCADAATGRTLWSVDLVKEYGSQVPEWYMGQCPLIDDGHVILAPSGSSLLVALDPQTGKPIWKTPNTPRWAMTHSSVSVMEVDGERTYVYCGSGGVAGVSAKDGKLLWQTTDWTVNTATVPSPVFIGDGKLFLSGGYNSGSMMLQVNKAGGVWSAKPLFRLGPEVFGSDLQTPILFRGNLYGVAPDGEMVCLGLDGKRIWASGSAGRFGMGAYMVVGDKILALNDGGVLTIADTSTTGFRAYGRIKVLEGRETWGPMAVAGDRLLVRDSETLECIVMGSGA